MLKKIYTVIAICTNQDGSYSNTTGVRSFISYSEAEKYGDSELGVYEIISSTLVE